jgi:hypothetical protein
MSEHDQSLAEAIAAAARNAFSEWRKTRQDERVFAFALSTIDDAIYINASVNTEESHRRTLGKSRVQLDAPEALYYKWGPWDWEYEYIAPSHFRSVDERLKAMYDKMHKTGFEAFRGRVFEAMLQALVLLRTEFAIPETPETAPVILFATIYDSHDAEGLQFRSAQAANPPDCVSEFLSSFEKWKD